MTAKKLQKVLDNIKIQKSMLKKTCNVLDSRNEKISLLSDSISEYMDSLIEELTSEVNHMAEMEKAKVRDNARERYNKLVESEGCKDLTIDTIYSRGTEGWNMADMVLEVKNLMYKMYASGDIMGGERYCRMYNFLKDYEGLEDDKPICNDHGVAYEIKKRAIG